MDPVAAVREALILHAAGDAGLPAEAYLAWDAPQGGRARTLNMPGFVGGSISAVGTKIINGNPHNIELGLPRASGVTLLFDRNTARPICIMDAAFISALRTAAVSLLCLQALRGPKALRIGVSGAGYLALHHILLLANRCKVDRISIYDTKQRRAEALKEAILSRGIKTPIDIVDSIEALVGEATCVVTTTTTSTPYISLDMISPGTLLINVSLDDFDRDVFLGADKLYVDDWPLISADEHRLLGRLTREGLVVNRGDPPPRGGRAIDGTIGQLLSGTCQGRGHDHEIILVNPFGMAIEDIAVAQGLYRQAVSQSRGHQILET
jgi:ornithine cyclodeaminase